MTHNLIVITGTPGTGKTTISEIISRELGFKLIKIADFVKNNNLILGYDKEFNSYIVDIKATRKKLEMLVSNPKDFFIIEGHLLDVIPEKNVKICIVLRLDPRILKKRLSERGYPENKIKNNIESEILDVLLVEAIQKFGKEKVFEIDTSGLSVKELVLKVIKIIKTGKNGTPGNVDWFKKLGSELDKYLL